MSFAVMLAAAVGAVGFGLYDAVMPVDVDTLDGRFVVFQALVGVAVLAGRVTVLRVCGQARPVASVNQ